MKYSIYEKRYRSRKQKNLSNKVIEVLTRYNYMFSVDEILYYVSQIEPKKNYRKHSLYVVLNKLERDGYIIQVRKGEYICELTREKAAPLVNPTYKVDIIDEIILNILSTPIISMYDYKLFDSFHTPIIYKIIASVIKVKEGEPYVTYAFLKHVSPTFKEVITNYNWGYSVKKLAEHNLVEVNTIEKGSVLIKWASLGADGQFMLPTRKELRQLKNGEIIKGCVNVK